VAELRERREDDDDQQLREGHGGRHGHAAVPAGDDDDEREREARQQRQAVAEHRAATGRAHHQDDAGERHEHRTYRAPREPLSEEDDAEAGSDEGSDGLQNQNVGDRGVVQRDNERGVGHGHGAGGQQSAAPGNRRKRPGLRECRVGAERHEPEDAAPRDLGCGADVQLALQDSGGGPRHSRQHRVDHSEPTIADAPAARGPWLLGIAVTVPVFGRAHLHVRAFAVTSGNQSRKRLRCRFVPSRAYGADSPTPLPAGPTRGASIPLPGRRVDLALGVGEYAPYIAAEAHVTGMAGLPGPGVGGQFREGGAQRDHWISGLQGTD
jgi:hypothetical protein